MSRSRHTIEFDDEVVAEQIRSILDTIAQREIKSKYSETGREVTSLVKEIVYAHKDEIVERVVNQAVKEITRKALPQLIERMSEK